MASSSTPSTGSLIWTALVPLLKIALVALAGFTLTKKGLFPPAASRGFSQVTMNLALPCLIFASIVPSFNPETAGSIGPLLLTAFIYELIGLVLAFVIREVCWVPREFQYGILIMGALSNWGALPTAIVQSVAASPPFDPATDPALGTGLVSIFILAYNLTFFTGVYRICGWDFMYDTPEPAPETMGVKWSRRKRWVEAKLGRGANTPMDALESGRGLEEGANGVSTLGIQPTRESQTEGKSSQEDSTFIGEKDVSTLAGSTDENAAASSSKAVPTYQRPRRLSAAQEQQLAAMDRLTRTASAATVDSVLPPGRRTRRDYHPPSSSAIKRRVLQSFHSHTHSHSKSHDNRLPPLPSSAGPSRAPSPTPDHHSEHTRSGDDLARVPTDPAAPPPMSRKKRYLGYAKTVFKTLATPITSSLIISIVIALVPPLKALFVHVPGWSGTRMPWAPDGRPPLAFVQDTAGFMGNICVPGATILLGASFARLSIPSASSPDAKPLPYTAIGLMTIMKMVILPVIGVLWVTSPALESFFPPDRRVLGFVAMLLSGTPAAVNQLVVTSLVAPEGKADVIAAFLLAQYIFMFISSTALTAIALKYVSD